MLDNGKTAAAPPMVGAKRGRKSLIWGLAAGAAILLVAALILFGPWRTNTPTVEVETMAIGPVTQILAVSGRVAARDQVQIRSAVAGTLLEVSVGEGSYVQKGDVLAQLDPSQQEAIVRQAASALRQGQVLQQQAQVAFARNQELANLVARVQLEDSKLALEGTTQDVARLTALLDQVTIQLERFTLRAPIAGTITTRSVDLGQLVDTATVLFTLANLDELLVETDVDEAYATRVAVGQGAVLQLVGNQATLEGKVIFVSPRVNPATGGVSVKLGFDVPVRAPIGLTVTANIVVDQTEALTVPRTALQGDAVFRVIDRRAVLTPVTVTDWPAVRLIVTDGLQVGDRVIVDSSGLTDGAKVAQGGP